MRSADKPARRGAEGFLLLEVTLATAIFCLVALALAGCIGDIAEAMRRSNRESRVRLGLETQLAEGRLLPVQAGVFREKPDAEGVSFEREWSPLHLETRDKTDLPHLFRLTVRARWTDRRAEDSEEAHVDVYRPGS